jgi:hypothetical protein
MIYSSRLAKSIVSINTAQSLINQLRQPTRGHLQAIFDIAKRIHRHNQEVLFMTQIHPLGFKPKPRKRAR